MIHTFRAPDALAAHDLMCKTLMFGKTPGRDYDWTHGTEVGLHNVGMYADSFDYNFNLARLWIPKSRWSVMARQYIDPDRLEDALAKVEERMAGKFKGKKGRGIAVLRTDEHELTDEEMFSDLDDQDPEIAELKTRMVQGKGTGRSVRRRWGSCMLNLSFRANPVPTISLHSRTTYFGYLAALDIAVAHAFAVRCGQVTGIHPGEMHFVWTLDLAQFHGFRSLAWALGDPQIKAKMDKYVDDRFRFSPRISEGNRPGFRKALDGYARILKSDRAGTLYGDESFSSFARIRRRFHTEVMGVPYTEQYLGGTRNAGGRSAFPKLPDVWSQDLDFSVLNGTSALGDSDDDGDEDDE